jgi:hypothetical protein
MVLELLVLTILFIIPGCFFSVVFFFGRFFFQTVFFFGPKNPERRWLYPKPGVVIKEPQAPSLHSKSTKKEGVDEGVDKGVDEGVDEGVDGQRLGVRR